MNVADLVNAVLEKKDYTARLVNGVSNYIRGYHQALVDIVDGRDSAWIDIYDVDGREIFQAWCKENMLPDDTGKTIGFMVSDGCRAEFLYAARSDSSSDFTLMNVLRNFYPKYWMPLPKIKINNNVHEDY